MSEIKKEKTKKEDKLEEDDIVNIIKKISDDQIPQIVQILENGILERTILLEKSRAGFSVKMRTDIDIDKTLNLKGSDLYSLVIGITYGLYHQFFKGKMDEDTFEKEEIEFINKVLDSLDENIRNHLLFHMSKSNNILLEVDYEINTKEIYGKNTLKKYKQGILYLENMADIYNKSFTALALSKIDIDYVIKKLGEIREKIEGEDINYEGTES